jgi:uncharacterized protein (DUF305 family)
MSKNILISKEIIAAEIPLVKYLAYEVIKNCSEELKRMEEFRKAQAEVEKKNDTKAVSQKMFKVV